LDKKIGYIDMIGGKKNYLLDIMYCMGILVSTYPVKKLLQHNQNIRKLFLWDDMEPDVMFGKLLVSTVGDMCRMLLCVMRSAIKIL
jgi:hypothetical protein